MQNPSVHGSGQRIAKTNWRETLSPVTVSVTGAVIDARRETESRHFTPRLYEEASA
jgi:hypothetical protein